MRRILLFCLLQAAACSQETSGLAARPSQSQAETSKGEQPAAVSAVGTVVLRVVIGPDGVPGDLEVIKSSSPEADKNALESVQRWRFRPAVRKGKAVPTVAVIEVNYGATAPQGTAVTQKYGSSSDADSRALLRWYLRAAAAGDASAEVEVARRLSSKPDGNYDLVHASAWAAIAAARGSKEGRALQARLAHRMTSEQVQAAGKMAADWRPGRALGDNPGSGNPL
jgi:TonB family protein